MKTRETSCRFCPFARDADPGRLVRARGPAEFLTGYSGGELPVFCHCETPVPNDRAGRLLILLRGDKGRDVPLCLGSLVFLHNHCKLPRDPDLAACVSASPVDVEMYFGDVHEFCSHHLPGCKVATLGHRVVYVGVTLEMASRLTLVANEDLEAMVDKQSAVEEALERLTDEFFSHRGSVDEKSEAAAQREMAALEEVVSLRRRLKDVEHRLRTRAAVAFGRFETLELEETP